MGLFDPDTTSVISRRSSRHGGGSSSKHHHGKEYKVVVRGDRDRERDRDRDRDRSRSRSRSRARSSAGTALARSFFGLDNSSRHSQHSTSHRHNKSTTSFFSLPNVSSRSFFGGGGSGNRGSASYYRRQPRSSFVQRAFRKLKRLLRDLVYYAKKHPWRVFVLAVLPLLTGGALTALLARFGLRLPPRLMRMLSKLGVGARAVSGDHIGLVGDAVRMAGAGGLAKAGAATLQRGRNGTMQWDRRTTERDYFGGRGSNGGGGGGGGGGVGGGGGWGQSISRMFS